MYKEIWGASIGEMSSCKMNFVDNNIAEVMQSTKSAKICPARKFPLYSIATTY